MYVYMGTMRVFSSICPWGTTVSYLLLGELCGAGPGESSL